MSRCASDVQVKISCRKGIGAVKCKGFVLFLFLTSERGRDGIADFVLTTQPVIFFPFWVGTALEMQAKVMIRLG